jgi:hypothetical protein
MLTIKNSKRGRPSAGPASPKREILFERCHLFENPESKGSPVHPHTKLQNIVTAAHSLTDNVRRYFPVKRKKWLFEKSDWNFLAREVGPHFLRLEDWINPSQHDFDNLARRDPVQILGINEFDAGCVLGLLECLRTVVRQYDAILEHYGVAEEISSTGDAALFWWN